MCLLCGKKTENGKLRRPLQKHWRPELFLPQIRFQLRVTIISKQKDTAQHPAQRIAQCDGDDRVCKLCDRVKIDLAEHDKAAHHDDHGGFCIADTPQCAGVYLIDAKGEVKRHFQTDEKCAIV